MEDASTISVVIPTKGRVDQIFRRLDSILKQTLLPHELILVNSSENANLGLFLKRRFPVDHPKIKYIRTEASVTEARNIGTQHGSGDVIFFFDARSNRTKMRCEVTRQLSL
jgi:glycosyltransferase involved in cell wall biosynthesis